MKKIKRLFTIVLAVLLALGLCVSFSSCGYFYCNPKDKDWYNIISLPNIDEPFNEIYDGCYSIKIDKDGNVVFKPLDGEEISGVLSTSPNKYHTWTNVLIEFENGITGTGRCYKNGSERALIISYNGNSYTFTGNKQHSKEEFENYRSQFIEFLINAYETQTFPTQEEILTNTLYQQFTNYYQIDPSCGGPIVYATVERVTIENIEVVNYGKEITINKNGQSIVCFMYEGNIVSNISNGEIKEIGMDNITEGDCLVRLHKYWSSGVEKYQISKIFYLENN